MKVYKKVFLLFIFFIGGFSVFASGKKDTTAEIISGNLKLRFYKNSGSFCLYRLSEIGVSNWVPLYDDRALASTNGYSLLVDNKIYPIKKLTGRNLIVQENNNEVTAIFSLTKDLSITQRFYFLESKSEISENVLCIETTFENTSGVAQNVALKAIFDTNLGEKQRVALYTDSQSIINETRLDASISSAKYIASANSISACMFFLEHENQTKPSEVFVANWDYLQGRKWVPNIVEGRSFSTKYYNNDSAILMVWKTKRLNLNEKYSVTNCIGYYNYLNQNTPQKVIDTHLKNLSEKDRRNYDEVKTLLRKIEEVKQNPENYSDDEINSLTNQVDNAIIDIQK